MASQHQNQPPEFDFSAANMQFNYDHVHDLQQLTTPLLLQAPMQRSWGQTHVLDDSDIKLTVSTQRGVAGAYAGYDLMEATQDLPMSSTASVEITAEEKAGDKHNDTFGLKVNESGGVLMWIMRRGRGNNGSTSNVTSQPFGTANIILEHVIQALDNDELEVFAPIIQSRVIGLSNAAAKRQKYLSKSPQVNPYMASKIVQLAETAESSSIVSKVIHDPDRYSRDYLKIQRFSRSEAQQWQPIEELTLRQEGTSYALDIYPDGSAHHSVVSTNALDSALATRPTMRAPLAQPRELARFAHALLDAEV